MFYVGGVSRLVDEYVWYVMCVWDIKVGVGVLGVLHSYESFKLCLYVLFAGLHIGITNITQRLELKNCTNFAKKL